MGLKGAKYIENKNIPWALSLKEDPEFFIYKIEKDGDNIILDYLVEGKGVSIYMTDHQKFQELGSKIEIISGGWYGDNGRWSPLERYSGKIICENAKEMRKISEIGKNFKFKVTKPFLSSNKVLLIESEKIGVVEIKCKKIIPQKYEIMLFSKLENKWKLRNSFVFE
ncbi:MAG: hypothetical protein Q8T03_02625 [Bacteroidota bacterium]|nr:hypothetical protein [Bacteroidota bacterium]